MVIDLVTNMRTSFSSVTSSDVANLSADLSSMKKYAAIEGNKVLGLYDEQYLAYKRLEEEKERDFFWLILHKAIIKKFLKNKIKFPEKSYYIAEVLETV